MEGIGAAASVIAVVQIAAEVAKLCARYIRDVQHAREDIRGLQSKAVALEDVLGQINKSSHSNISQATIQQCSDDLTSIREKLEPKKRHTAMKRIGMRALKWPLTSKEVEEKVKALEGYLSIFNAALQLNHITISQGIGSKLDRSRDDQLLKTISHVGDAAYNSYENQRHRQCLANTRVDILREITEWANSNSSQYVFWLRGRAGTGKSTIALTIAQSLDRPGAVLASFFFKRGGGDLARSRKVISTIAFQLAIRSRLLASFICEALQGDPSLGDSASLSQQFDNLLLRPLQKVQTSAAGLQSFVVVLDALDECDDSNDIRLLLRLLGTTQNMAGLGLRVLLTSRPEVPIRLGFQNMTHIVYHELALHDIPRTIVDQDIKRFVTHELTRIKAERNLPNLWPGEDKIQTITARADGLFIYAATVCRYVDGPRLVSASVRLEQVCQLGGAKHKSTDVLDEMYSMVLNSSMKDDFSADEAEEVIKRLRHVIGSVVLLVDSLSAMELARLLFPTVPTGGMIVQQTLDPLHAIFDVPEDLTEPIRMLHLSVRDFLMNSARCPDARFQIDQRQVHHDLSIHCLDLMKQSLGQNMCQLPRYDTFVVDISETTMSQYLPLGLRYACCNWIDHLEHGQLSLVDNGPVHSFLRQYCSYWLEVMCIISKMTEATNMMRKLRSLVQVKKAPELYFFVGDALRFMLTFRYVLTNAPLQLYSAGMIFSPLNSVFRECFGSQASVNFEVRTQLLNDWNACIQTLEGHLDDVCKVVFSPDGSRVASGSYDTTVRVWDVQTGQCEQTLKDHSHIISDVMFSPDGLRLVSGSSDRTIRVWDVQTGQCEHTLEGHSDGVTCVVFSPDGSRVASGSYDKTVRVWDIQTGHCEHTLEGHHLQEVESVVFSSDGSRVASDSEDYTLRVWDVQTGRCEHTLEGHSDKVTGVMFSPRELHMVSCSYDKTVRIWNVQSGQCEQTLKGHLDHVTCVVFSPDGSRVASGSSDETVRIWDVQTGRCEHTFKGQLNGVSDVVFSPDGSCLASGSYDKTVRVWDVQTGECQHTFKGHSKDLSSVVFSPDGSYVASSSRDKTVRIWDVQTGQYEHRLEGHSDRVSDIVFSPDGSCVASSSFDTTVRVWDVQTGRCRHTLKGHSGYVRGVVFSPDGSCVASGSSDTTVRVWDVQTGRSKHTLNGHLSTIVGVIFSSDGSRVVSGSFDKTVRVWDVQTGRCEHMLEGHLGGLTCVILSPDGSHVASGSIDKTVRIWDIQTGQCEHTLKGHLDRVSSVVFSPDGSCVASGSFDTTVRVWDILTGQCEHTLEGHLEVVTSVMFLPDGSRVASGSVDETVRLWDIADAIEILCYDTGTHAPQIKLSRDSTKIVVNGNLLSVASQMPSPSIPAQTPEPDPHWSVSKLGINGDWVTLSSQRILWLPPEYRPGEWASHNDTIVIGSGTGQVTFVHCNARLFSSL